VRGETGVGEFTKHGVYVGNLGTGYCFLESGMGLTTIELLAHHSLWLLNLVQAVARVEASRLKGVIWSAPEGDAMCAALAGAGCLKSARMADSMLMLMGPIGIP